jgi:hypothetical protein
MDEGQIQPDVRKPRTSRAAKVVLLVVCTVVGVFLLLPAPGIDNSGSPELALQWKAVLEPLPDPERAKQAERAVQGRRFENGEWAFGLCRNSHHAYKGKGGGTLVVKDSRGDVRVFFGHVCGPRFLEAQLEQAASLDDLYGRCLKHMSE